jgi:serine/threonine protein kinase
MGILEQVRNDADVLRGTIASLRTSRVVQNGVVLTGERLEAVLAQTSASLDIELKRLELILESGIIPEKYQSTITKKTYLPSSEELLQQSEPLPLGKHAVFALKYPRKSNQTKNSRFELQTGDAKAVTTFHIEHKDNKSYPSGGFALKVKKGYTTADTENSQPKYAVKIFKKDCFPGNTIHELRIAMRAAYCYKQLGREGHAFRANGKQYIATEWFNGANLDQANQEQLQSMPIPRRIVMAISLLRELSIIHKLGFIFHDIKPGNVMVNFGKLNFVDIDSIGVKGEMPAYGILPMCTIAFLPSAQMAYDVTHNPHGLYLKFNEQTDMYAMGLTLAHLFQEVYIPQATENDIKVNGASESTFKFTSYSISHGPKYAENQALQKILKSMIFHDNAELSTADDYIDALKKALLAYPGHEQYLIEDRLAELSSAPLSKDDGKKAFKEIEVELLGFNRRANDFSANRFNFKSTAAAADSSGNNGKDNKKDEKDHTAATPKNKFL